MIPGQRYGTDHELLLRETHHRCGNDLQLVVGLLVLHSRSAASSEVRDAFADVTERVTAFARARATRYEDRPPSLENAIQQVCEALRMHAEPRAITISLRMDTLAEGLSAARITTLSLVVNELVTNAIKHAFTEGGTGNILISVSRNTGGDVVVFIEDDGRPLPAWGEPGAGFGLTLARRMIASVDGLFIPPPPGTKVFELRVPGAAEPLPRSK